MTILDRFDNVRVKFIIVSFASAETEQLLHANSALLNKLNYRQIALVKHALKHPNFHYQIEGHRQSHNVTYDTARTYLLKLTKFGLLKKQKTGKAFTFIAPDDLRVQIEKLIRKINRKINLILS